MNTDRIIRVWGTADNIDLIFTYDEKKDNWYTSMPIDFEDGWYSAVLFAENEGGRIGTWNGILYVSNGFSCLHLKQEPFSLWLRQEPFKICLCRECDYHDT